MLKQKTQQFAKFYIKDIETKLHKIHNEKSSLDEVKVPSAG